MAFKYRKKIKESDGPYESFKIWVPKEQFELLKEQSKALLLPISQIIAVAIDKERDAQYPFYYLFPSIKETIYVPHAYSSEAQKIVEFLYQFPAGITKAQLVIFRHSIGIPNKVQFLLALRECLQTKRVIETDVKPGNAKFEFATSQRWLKLSDMVPNPKKMERDRKKIEHLEKLLAEQKLELSKKEAKSGRSFRQETPDSEEAEE